MKMHSGMHSGTDLCAQLANAQQNRLLCTFSEEVIKAFE